MFKKLLSTLALIFITLAFISCGGNSNDKKDNKDSVKTVKKEPIKVNKAYTDIAKFISGMKVDEKSELFELSNEVAIKSYSASTDSSWARLEKRRFSQMRTWAETELTDLNKDINAFLSF